MKGTSLILRGRRVRIDELGFISLDDIFGLASCPKGKGPTSWSRSNGRHAFIHAVYQRVIGHKDGQKFRTSDVLRLASPQRGGSWAHPIIAASYAGFLNPKLEVEVNEVWLRYQSGDETLVNEVRENAARRSQEETRWVHARNFGKERRRDYTQSLADHGVVDEGYGICTNAAYRSLFGAGASALKKQRGLRNRQSLRDGLTTSELSFLAAAEALSAERIEEENPFGTPACAEATRRSSDRIREAIEADRKDRLRSLSGRENRNG